MPALEAYADWLQLWPYAILTIVIASWALYHFFAPASWREWAGAGLVQAFIIALYAETYGSTHDLCFDQHASDRHSPGA